MAFVFLVVPTSWALYRVIPDGRVKQILFKRRSNADASFRDQAIMTTAVVAFYAALGGVVPWIGF